MYRAVGKYEGMGTSQRRGRRFPADLAPAYEERDFLLRTDADFFFTRKEEEAEDFPPFPPRRLAPPAFEFFPLRAPVFLAFDDDDLEPFFEAEREFLRTDPFFLV